MHARLVVTIGLLCLGLVGCGGVEGICHGEQSDNIDCTIDVCDGETGAYAHLPDNSRCGAGMVCNPTGGCVAGNTGDAAGRATLLGYTDNTGITVSADGTTVSAMTAADGTYKLTGLTPGVYTIKFSYSGFITEELPGIQVVADAQQLVSDVQLAHGEQWAADRTFTNVSGVQYTPDHKYMVEIVSTNFGSATIATPLDGSKQPVTIANVSGVSVTNTHAVWSQNGSIWARAIDGSGIAYRLGTAPAGGSISVVGTPKTYTIMRKMRTVTGTQTYTESSIWIARTDGSVAPAATPAWKQADGQHGFATLAGNDTTAFMILNNTTVCCSGPPTDGVANLHRIDLATGVDTPMNPFPASSGGIFSTSPDGNYVYGYLVQNQANGCSWYRAFIAPITGATPGASPSFAPNYGAGACNQYSDFANYAQWVTDSSAVVLSTTAYTNSANVTTGGELKVWLRNQPSATTLSGYQTYNTCCNSGSLQVVGKVAIFTDTANKNLKVVSLDQTNPISITLDASANALAAKPWTVHGTTEYIVWAQQNSSGGVGKILATNISVPLTTAPVVQLGTDVPPSCAFEGVLSNTRFYELCSDTGQLTAFDQNTSSPSGQTTGVLPGLIPLYASNAIAFTKSDGFLYAASNTGTFGTSVKLISNKIDTSSTMNIGKWLLFNDSANQVTRISNVDGSKIDEPLSECNALSSYAPTMDTAKTMLWIPNAYCSGPQYEILRFPVTTLP